MRTSIRRPRRVPVAKASEDIVTAIIEAAIELLSEGGLEALTTNHVAVRAGVSVGSVYRYFADKHAIIAEIGRRQRQDFAERLLATLESEGDLETIVRRAMELFFLVEAKTITLRTVLIREDPPSWVTSTGDDEWNVMQERAARALARHMPELPLDVAVRRSLIALHAAQGVFMGHTLWNPEIVQSRGPELVEEMLQLALGYLRGTSTAAA